MAGPISRKRHRRVGKKLAPFLFLAPFVLLFAAFLIAPMLYALNLAVYKTTVVAGTKFVGADNFVRALGDPKFWQGVVVLLKFAVIQIPGMVAIALLIALILDSGTVYAKSFFRISLFLPYAVPAVIATLIWGYLYVQPSVHSPSLRTPLGFRRRISSARMPFCRRSPISPIGNIPATK